MAAGSFRIVEAGGSGLISFSEASAIARRLLDGGLAVLPTETGYMLAALATSEPALLRAFELKERPLTNPMHVGCASIEMAERFAVLSGGARDLLAEFTPGPLTVVVPQTDLLPDRLVTLNRTVGIRIPDHPATLQVIAAVGAPLSATSFNRSGEETRPVDAEYLATFDWSDQGETPVVVDPAAVRYSAASTLVSLVGPEPRILRAGPVGEDEVRKALAAQTR